MGAVAQVEERGGGRRLSIEFAAGGRLRIGDSIAVNGACLTLVDQAAGSVAFDVSAETLSCTTLGALGNGDRVNLEQALRADARLNGHFVSGHVDGVGVIAARAADGESQRFVIEAPAELARYLGRKGSVCVDGVSLTINTVDGGRFGVNLIPHTLACTTFGTAAPGTRVNIEVDLLARYLERLLAER
jgi:riboflavin synthase